MLRVARAKELFGELGIPVSFLEYALENNSGRNNPYHNNHHLLTVMLRCAEGADYYGLSVDDKRNLVVAGLFHDYNHSLSNDDAENIRKSVAGWTDYKDLFAIVGVSASEVERLIAATVFPHKDATDLGSEIIQDADLMQSLEPDAESFFKGLSVEAGVRIDAETTRIWISQQHINTQWAKNEVAKHFPGNAV